MRVSEALILDDFPRDLTREEELRALGEDDRVEMTNLHEWSTGLKGVLFISSRIPQHGPCVKYFLRQGGR